MTLKYLSVLCDWFYALLSSCIVILSTCCTIPLEPLPSWKKFQASVFLAIILQPLTPIFFKSFSTSSNHLFLRFPTDLFLSGIFLNTFFTVLSSYILSTCSTHRTFPFWFSTHTSINSCLVRIPHAPLFLLAQIFFSMLYFYNIS